MTRKRKPYKTYSKEFKLEALRLVGESERPTSEIAMQLGIRRNDQKGQSRLKFRVWLKSNDSGPFDSF